MAQKPEDEKTSNDADQAQGPPKLHGDLQNLLDEFRKARDFKAEEWIDNKVKLFNDYMTKCKLKGCVINLSGGVDSAVTLGLMCRAKAQKGSSIEKVVAVSQPIHSSDWAFDRAAECAKAFGVEMVTLDQTPIYDSLKKLIDGKVGVDGNAFASGQLRSYMRTPAIYYVAQLLSSAGTPTIVMGTGNKDEDGYLAYFCKAGDGVVDVQLIADLHKSEVFAVGAILKVPESILKAAPSADLWDAQTDEEELGFPYDFIELWTNFLAMKEEEQAAAKEKMSEEGLKQFDEMAAKAVQIHKRNQHKLDAPLNL
jgi:NAD+ synthase (glutamine-hydrolysing)